MKKRIGVSFSLFGLLACLSFSNGQEMTEEEIRKWAMQQSGNYLQENNYATLKGRIDCTNGAFIDFPEQLIVDGKMSSKLFDFTVKRVSEDSLILEGYVDHSEDIPRKALIKVKIINDVDVEYSGKWYWYSSCNGVGKIDNLGALKIEK